MSTDAKTYKFPDRVWVNGTVFGIVLGTAPDHPGEVWVATLTADGENRFDWVPVDRVLPHGMAPPAFMRPQPAEVIEAIAWTRQLLGQINEAEDDISLTASNVIETIQDRLKVLAERLGK